MLFWTVSKKPLRFRDPFYMMRSKQLRTCTRIHCLLFIYVAMSHLTAGFLTLTDVIRPSPFQLFLVFKGAIKIPVFKNAHS